MAEQLYPLRFTPILKREIWGGRRLGTLLGKPIGPESDYAESWEVADHGSRTSVVMDGPLAGVTLHDLMRRYPDELMGNARPSRGFPLLIKFLDANSTLSVQVHPDDALGGILAGDCGKTEAWVVMQAEPGSALYVGLRRGATAASILAAIENEEIESLLHRVEPKEGDCYFIPAGIVHAIGAGVVLAEIQQTSDATFRLYDWGRKGADGLPRSLHIDQALQCIDFDAGPVSAVSPSTRESPAGRHEDLVSCPYFILRRHEIHRPHPLGTHDRFTILIGLDGAASVEGPGFQVSIQRGTTLLLPACLGPCRVIPNSNLATVLECVVP